MSKKNLPSDPSSDLEAAAHWWVRLRDAHAEDALLPWQSWHEQDPRHADAFDQVAELGSLLSDLDEETKAQWISEFVDSSTSIPHRRWVWMTTAAAVLLAVGSVVPLFYERLNAGESQHFSSAVGSNEQVLLADHSRVQLGGATTLTARMDGSARVIELQRGEAFFQVQHDSKRPFLVHAGSLSVQATGTAFDVRRVGDRVDVVVTEGRVLVAGRGRFLQSHAADAIQAEAGQDVRYDPSANGLTIATVDPSKVLAWRGGRLEYVNEPLSGVISDLNRYSKLHLSIADSALAAMDYSGTIELDHFDGWLHGLPYVFPVKVVRASDQVTLVRVD
ncbi:FecR family protein [Frateuria aurantia]